MCHRVMGCIALLLVLTGSAEAQRRSRSSHSSGRGVPCGNSYISADKVCHIAAAADTAKRAPDSTGARPQQYRAALVSSDTARAVPVAPQGAPVGVPIPAQPLRELSDSLLVFANYRVVVRNAPIDDRWLREVRLRFVRGDYLVLESTDDKSLRIPMADIAMYYTDRHDPMTLVLVLRR